jgi:flagellar biosynthesis protein FlhB
MSMFKALFSFSNTSVVHKSILIISFLVSAILIFVKNFFDGMIALFGESTEGFFNLFINASSKTLPFTIGVFVISYTISYFLNLSND